MFKKQVSALLLACAMSMVAAPVMGVHAAEVIQVTDANSKNVAAQAPSDATSANMTTTATSLEPTATTNKNIVQVTDANSKNVAAAPAPAAVAVPEAAPAVATTDAAQTQMATTAMTAPSGGQTTTPGWAPLSNTTVMSVR